MKRPEQLTREELVAIVRDLQLRMWAPFERVGAFEDAQVWREGNDTDFGDIYGFVSDTLSMHGLDPDAEAEGKLAVDLPNAKAYPPLPEVSDPARAGMDVPTHDLVIDSLKDIISKCVDKREDRGGMCDDDVEFVLNIGHRAKVALDSLELATCGAEVVPAETAGGSVSVCDNCSKKWKECDLKEVEHLSMRVAPGGTVPSGECPECGSLCFPMKEAKP